MHFYSSPSEVHIKAIHGAAHHQPYRHVQRQDQATERMFPGVPGEMMECRWLAPVKKE